MINLKYGVRINPAADGTLFVIQTVKDADNRHAPYVVNLDEEANPIKIIVPAGADPLDLLAAVRVLLKGPLA
jgi:hypothetical protein